MASKQDIAKATLKLVEAQQRSLQTGGLQDQTPTDRESQDEEILEDEQNLLSPPSLLNISETGV